jgi:MerR family transcriptional regulator, thiopeptide resistance regulator
MDLEGLTVKELARLAGVSVRTLHHYDAIGLLRPDARSEAGYRLYGRGQLLRLQQILFFRELEFPLAEIARVLAEPNFDPARALRGHRKTLEDRIGRLHRLLDTLDKTVAHYEGEHMLTEEEMYRGFAPEKITRMKREARERWGNDLVEASEQRVRGMTREKWEAVGREGAAVNADLAALLERDPGDAAVQAVVARHRAWIEHFWKPDAESYRGLGRGYAEDPEFRAFYENIAPGLADFLRRAIDHYCEDFPAVEN